MCYLGIAYNMHIQHAHGRSNSWLSVPLGKTFHFVWKAELVVSALGIFCTKQRLSCDPAASLLCHMQGCSPISPDPVLKQFF